MRAQGLFYVDYGLFASGVRAHNIVRTPELLAAPIQRQQEALERGDCTRIADGGDY